MVQQSITLCGKDVQLAYCYATEVSFRILAEEDIHAFLQEATVKVQQQQMPDIKKCILLILACLSAYYESKGEPLPLEDKDLMYNCEVDEMGTAIGTCIKLYMEFYHLPGTEAAKAKAEAQKGSKGKN